MKVTNLRVNHVARPMGFQTEPLSISWHVIREGTEKNQKWARIQIWKKDELCYDSGQDEQADSKDYQVDMKLDSRTRYRFGVTVMADNGESASAESWFETGKMGEDWNGVWITPGLEKNTPPVLRKKFTLETIGGTARLYMCGLGVYEAYLNGRKIGDEFLAPGYHSYDFHLQTQVYDVTDYIKKGQNELQIWLADGWFKGRLGFDSGFTDIYGERYYAIAELYMEEDDQSRIVVKTDETWECKASPVLFANIYDGEYYDAGKEADLEKDEGWQNVNIQEPPNCGKLTERYSLPVIKKEYMDAVSLIKTPKEETGLDFGQNLTGWVEFKCMLPKGEKIRLTVSEIMQDGCFYHENYRTAKSEFVYISDGRREWIRPHFTFYGFRYICVEVFREDGSPDDTFTVRPEDFRAVHLRSDFDQTGQIETGHSKINQLFSNALWSQKDNFLDIPSDCPQRDERLGWTGDAQIFSETACYNMYVPAFFRKYLWDMRAEQSALGGSVPNVVPRLKRGMIGDYGSSPWAEAGVLIPWNVYRHYGSKTLLTECYPGMKSLVEYIRRKETAQEGPHLVKDGFHFADWLALDNKEPGPLGATDSLFIASAYYYKCASVVSQAAEILGYEEDAVEYRKLAEEIKEAVTEKYYESDGSCVCKTQTSAAISVMMGLGDVKKEGELLQERIMENDGHLNTGFVGTAILCSALSESGHGHMAADLLLNEEYPGWLYSINLGATTVWERWNSVMPDGHMNPEGMNSLNHYSYGSIVAWMYAYLCGIQLSAPGFKKVRIEPHPDQRLGFACCSIETAQGLYKSSWKYGENGRITYEFQVPFGGEAEVIMGDEIKILCAGEYLFDFPE